MTSDQVLEGIKRIIAEDLELNIKYEDLTPTVPLFEDGLALDSVVLVELISFIEKRFDIVLPDDLLTVDTFKDLQSVAQVVGARLAMAPTTSEAPAAPAEIG
jgi:acyl carrier protein